MKVFLNLQSFVLRTKKDFYFDAIFYFHFCLFGFKMLPFLGGGTYEDLLKSPKFRASDEKGLLFRCNILFSFLSIRV